MSQDISLFEVMRTQRAVRRFKPDPVPDALLRQVLEAATHAPSGGNRQPWFFMVVREPNLKRKIGDYYRGSWYSRFSALPGPETANLPTNVYGPSQYLADHMADAPVLILACFHGVGSWSVTPPGARPIKPEMRFASVYPAVQNLLLAARALGLGTTLTTVHIAYEEEIKELLGIPADVETAALIPLGYPENPDAFRPHLRSPVEEVVFHDRWGNPPHPSWGR